MSVPRTAGSVIAESVRHSAFEAAMAFVNRSIDEASVAKLDADLDRLRSSLADRIDRELDAVEARVRDEQRVDLEATQRAAREARDRLPREIVRFGWDGDTYRAVLDRQDPAWPRKVDVFLERFEADAMGGESWRTVRLDRLRRAVLERSIVELAGYGARSAAEEGPAPCSTDD